ncbi:MAG TPA: hypothetical protein VFA74_20085 [Terriglobales bacterium]|nr:hypothetical protein [Terriglobales bacterium]
MKQNTIVRGPKWFRNILSLVEISNTRFTWTLFLGLVCLAVPMLSSAADNVDSTAVGTRTVEGLVRDIACPLQNKKSTATSYSKDCIAMCAKVGSPLGILTNDGSVYVPVTESMPDTGQSALKSFVGEHVQATGKVFERNGAHAIEISEIHQLSK